MRGKRSMRSTPDCREQIFPLRPRSLRPWMLEIDTPQVTQRLLPSTRAISPNGWASRTKISGLAHLCGLVHDIGKIGLPPGLLEKPGALTLDERRQMEHHSEIGERILANVEDYDEIARIVRHHHERMDGNGYPDRIAGSDIPLLSRIISVADAYNAMTSDRPYRDAMPSRVARLRLAQAVESQFDTNVVAAFEAILAGATEEYRAGLNLTFETEASAHEALAVQAAVA